MKTPVDGERERLRHIVETMRASLHALELALNQNEQHGQPLGCDAVQALQQEVGRLVWHAASLDAYERARSKR